jgi:hypothetical protein
LIWARALAVLAAAFLVGAFALATLLPPLLPLGAAVSWFGHGALLAMHDAVTKDVSEWAWWHLVMPLMVRPCWLLPASLGLLLGGMALTVASAASAPGGQRRRS